MTANELMIGNWVQVHPMWQGDGKENYRKVDIDMLYRIGKDVTNVNPFYQPIPLTPEILEKSGFVQNSFKEWVISINPHKGGLNEIHFSGDYLYIRQGIRDRHSREDDLVVLWNKDVMKQWHLHQLQNLYYALTSTTLPITF